MGLMCAGESLKKEIKRYIRLKTLDVDNNHIEVRLDLIENGKVVKTLTTEGGEITLGFLKLYYGYGSQNWILSYVPEVGNEGRTCKSFDAGTSISSIPRDFTSDRWHFTGWQDCIYYDEDIDMNECTLGFIKSMIQK